MRRETGMGADDEEALSGAGPGAGWVGHGWQSAQVHVMLSGF